MNKQPLVSVVMAYYDSAAFLPEAVESVLCQTYENLELIVVDDCSPQSNAAEILSSIKDKRISVLRHHTNQGLAGTRNSAVKAARGDLLVSLDGDDKLAGNFISETLAALGEDDGGIYTQVQIFGELDLLWVPDCTLVNLMCALPGPSTFLYRRAVFDAVGGYCRDFYHADTEFMLRALSQGWKFRRLDQPLYFYRKHAQGMTSTNRAEEVPELARGHKQLYIDNLDAVLRAQESKYWQAKDEYQALEQGFRNVMGHYQQLQNDHEELLAKYRNLEKTHYIQRLFNFVQRVNPRRSRATAINIDQAGVNATSAKASTAPVK